MASVTVVQWTGEAGSRDFCVDKCELCRSDIIGVYNVCVFGFSFAVLASSVYIMFVCSVSAFLFRHHQCM